MKKLKKWDEAVLIPIDSLVFTDWNCNVLGDSEFAELCSEIKEGGFDEPCQVVPLHNEDEGKYLVLGGEHRVRSMKAQGETEVPCIIKKHLEKADEKELMIWSVKRNGIRGKIDIQKYGKLERRLSEKWDIAADAARRKMLIKDEMLTRLKGMHSLEDNETPDLGKDLEVDMMGTNGEGSSKEPRDPSEKKSKLAERKSLLAALREAEQDVLLQSGDTIEQGYLFFEQSGGLHLIVHENETLKNLITEMVSLCKNNSDKVNEFFISAINKELPNWR